MTPLRGCAPGARPTRAAASGAALLAALLLLPGCVVLDAASDAPRPLVATSHPAATEAGLSILRAGGNAVDAAAAVQLALNVVEPMMSGIGGGAFLLLYHAGNGTFTALDGRETAPAATTPDAFQRAALTGGLDPRERGIAVGVPGTLAAWDEALRRFGTRTLADVAGPAIRLAETGFEVDGVTSGYVAAAEGKLRRWPASAHLLLKGATCPPQEASQIAAGPELIVVPCEGGVALAPGDRLVQPALARTLRLLASQGPPALYGGPLGEGLLSAQASRGGGMTRADLLAYRVEEREVLVREWRGLRVATMGLPSSGVLLHEALAILEPLAVAPRADPAAAHNVVEALHLAFADRRAYLGDPATALATPDQLLDPAFVASRRDLLDPGRTGAPYPPGTLPGGDGARMRARAPVAEGSHTTHFTVMDARGNVVAATSTIESLFGSGMLVPEHGFFLNNELTDFDLEPGGPNEPGPGKRPLSSMTPTIVLDERGPLLALGSPGGGTIPGTVLQVLLDVLVDGTDLGTAVATPRWAALGRPPLAHEVALDGRLRAGLGERGHEWVEVEKIGGVQAIHRADGKGWIAAADPRRAGAYGTV